MYTIPTLALPKVFCKNQSLISFFNCSSFSTVVLVLGARIKNFPAALLIWLVTGSSNVSKILRATISVIKET